MALKGLKLEFWIFSNDIKNSTKYIEAGVTHICIDIEINGKEERQIGRNGVISRHNLDDLNGLSKKIGTKNSICRINPLYSESINEINKSIEYGAGSIILPYFHSVKDIKRFIEIVDGRTRTIGLVETMSSFMRLPEIINIKGLDCIHIGLNDLSLNLNFDDMFEVVKNGWMEIVYQAFFSKKDINFGFGGISTLNDSGCKYPALEILRHHKRCNSDSVILSRRFLSYCKKKSGDNEVQYWNILKEEITRIKSLINS